MGGDGGQGGTGGVGVGGHGALPFGNVPGSVGYGGNGYGGTGGSRRLRRCRRGGRPVQRVIDVPRQQGEQLCRTTRPWAAPAARAVVAARGSAVPAVTTCEPGARVAAAGSGSGGKAGDNAQGGLATGGGIDNAPGGTLTNSVAVTFTNNVAVGGTGGAGGSGGEGVGGNGGQGSAGSFGGFGGFGASGGSGGVGGVGLGGGLFNSSGATASFAAKKNVSSETLAVYTNNSALGGLGGARRNRRQGLWRVRRQQRRAEPGGVGRVRWRR